MSKQTVACVIPARLASSRFPEKVLATLAGKPMLEWVWRAATSVSLFDSVTFAVDSKKTADLVSSFGANWVMTDPACPSGTHRMIQVAQSKAVQADIWVDWQGDEPFISATMIEQLLQSCTNSHEIAWTLKKLIVKKEEIHAPNIAKVVCDAKGFAMYFSRSAIPCFRDESDLQVLVDKKVYFKHVGIYAYRTNALDMISKLPPSALEEAEKLEMLPFLEHNIPLRVHQTDQEVIGIDTPDDLARAAERCKKIAQNQ